MAGTALLPSIAIFFFSSFYLPSNLEASGGFSVDLIHRDSPRSPFYNSSETLFDRMSRAIRQSNSRLDYFMSRFSGSSTTATSKVTGNGASYLMTISLGTPPVQILAIADTGSDLTWTQCPPCESCFKQLNPLFDPSRSSTYHEIPCNSGLCTAISASPSCQSDESCQYIYGYGSGNGSNTEGVLASETFSMASTTRNSAKIPNVPFGCAHNSDRESFGNMDGIVGLGRGPLSLVNNLGSGVAKKFAYCLVPQGQNYSSRLDFGDIAVVSGEGSVSTPVIINPGADVTFYFLHLEKISVGETTITVPSSADGNMFIDSGTTLTLVPKSIYPDLVSALKALIHLPPTQGPAGDFGLCYEAGGDTKFPDLRFGFEGGDVVLGSSSTFSHVDENVACLAILPSDGMGIFGNLAQQNFKIGYDLDNKKITFLPTDCTKN